MSGIVERGVDAMLETIFAEHELPVESEIYQKYLDTFRAALRAIRILTPEEMSAAWPGFRQMDHGQGEYCWQAVIDEALK